METKLKLFYLLIHPESDSIFIAPDDEVENDINLGCDIISQGYDVDALIMQGFKEARKHNCHFAGYKEPDKIRTGLHKDKIFNHYQKKAVEVKPGTKAPINLKHKRNDS